MKTVLALDPGFSGTKAGIWDLSGREVASLFVPRQDDPLEAALASFGVPPSIVVVPGGPPGAPWHPFCVVAVAARSYCSSRAIPLIELAPGCPAELPPEARLSGARKWTRQGWFYAAPQRAAFEEAAAALSLARDTARIVTVYLGDEVSVTSHDGDRVVDTSDPVMCEGPFGLTSAGTLPATTFVAWVAAVKREAGDLRDQIKSGSGAFACAGVHDLKALAEDLDRGQPGAAKAVLGMSYQVSKEVGRQVGALLGRVDCIALCGPGVALDALVAGIEARVRKWCPVYRASEDLAMQSLVREGIRALSSNDRAKTQ